MSTASTRIPKPKDWQEFERQIEVLAQCWLDDPAAKGNGRQGQRQNGVDVFGRRDKVTTVGFQCKEKFDKQVSEDELRDEVKKAEGFRPELKEFVLVTTAVRDAKIQQVARLITESRDDFSVDVWSWEEIEQLVIQYPQAMRAFDPTYHPLIADEIKQFRDENSFDNAQLLAEVRDLKNSLRNDGGAAPAIATENDTSTELHGQITLIQTMIDEGDVVAAIPLLDRIVAKSLASATPSETYRIKIAQANVLLKGEKFETAGQLLIEATERYPEHKNAPSNLAIGYLLTAEAAKAESAAANILASDPNNQKMAETLAQARAQQHKGDPFEGIDQALLNSSVIWTLRCTLARMQNNENWRQIAHDGLAEHSDDKFLKRFAAEAIVDDCIADAPAFIVGEPTNSVTHEQIDKAADELADQIAILRSIGGDVPAALAHNAALACRLADRFDQALEIIETAIADHPDEHWMIEQAAMHMLHHGDPSDAVALLEGADRSDGANLTLSAAYIEQGRFDEAKALLDKQQYPTAGDVSPFQFLGIHFEWFQQQKLLTDAQVFFDKLSKQYIHEVPPLLFRAKIERLLGNEVDYADAITAAVERVSRKTAFAIIYELADEAYRGQQNEVVVELLKDRVSLDHQNQPLSLCIAAAMNGDLHKTASELLDRVPDDVSEERWYRRVRVALANKIGSKRTLPLLNAFLNDFSNDAEMRTARIGLWQTQGHTGKIRKDIEETEFAALAGSPFSLMQFYRIATTYSDGAKSVPLAYRLLLENWESVDCHTGYHGIFLANEKIAAIDLAPKEVRLDCAFRVASEKKEERWHRIEEKKPAVFGDEWLSPDDELAKAFFGKSVGDRVNLSGAFGETEIELLEIKSVYLDAFHRSTSRFQDRFPNSGAMFQLSVDTEAEDPFVEMKQMVRRMSERDEELLNVYRDNPIPLVWLAGVLGKDEIECSIGLPAEMGIPFRVCQGTREERDAAFSVIKNNGRRGVIVDATSAVMIKRLDVQKAVEAVCGPIKTTATTIERLTERFHEVKGMIGRSMGSLGYRDGKYILTDHSEEQQRAALTVREKELQWARKHLAIVPSLPQADLSEDARQIADIVGMRAIAPVLAADGADLPLLADDFGIRLWAKAALKIEGLWLQPILMEARNGGHLTEDSYAKAILEMAEAGFSYISLDNRTLLYALREANFNVDHIVKPLQTLLGKSADLNPNLGIAISVMIALRDEKCPPITIYKLASEIARAASYPRWDQVKEILSIIASAPIPQRALMRDHLNQWYWWNSMGANSGPPPSSMHPIAKQ